LKGDTGANCRKIVLTPIKKNRDKGIGMRRGEKTEARKYAGEHVWEKLEKRNQKTRTE